ncbi:hypothetical protein E7811_15240 [Aliigemmobacter aestuarii]|uniref:ChrB C-terminal domain-containing protein n=1 Tax=Aliigemmobacter aestuarii TaxID=1445661 RepID=A0A4S3MLM6_9RHOB|nr:hypothetical protein E7811_15240 [Gemmobacter aestuarii]
MPNFNQIAPSQLFRLIGTPEAPRILDICPPDDFAAMPAVIPTTERVAPEGIAPLLPGLAHPALDRLALIVRAADTNRPDLAPQAAGLLAVSVGLSRQFRNDMAQLEAGMAVYDALYRWARDGFDGGHDWPAGR